MHEANLYSSMNYSNYQEEEAKDPSPRAQKKTRPKPRKQKVSKKNQAKETRKASEGDDLELQFDVK